MEVFADNDSQSSWLQQQFEEVASAFPESVAVSFGGSTLTYSELNTRANLLANWMIAGGIGPEARVGVCLKPGMEIIVTLIAIQKAGAVYLPINHEYPIARVEKIIEDAKPVLTVTQAELIDTIGDTLPNPITLEQIRAKDYSPNDQNPTIRIHGTNTACIFYTSGTTGTPKGIPISYQGLSYYIRAAQKEFGIGASDTVLTIAKYSFSISLFDLLTAVTSGGHLIVLPREKIMDFRLLAEAVQGATVMHIGPNLLKGLLHYITKAYSSSERFSNVRHLSSGGDFVPAELLERLKATFSNAEIYVIYGCTEVACMGCYYPVPRNSPIERSYVGKPFPSTTVVLIGEDCRRVEEGQAGEVCFAGPGVMAGYLNNPELTERALVLIDGKTYFRTGDIGRIDQTGNLEFLGRRDFQIKINGQRIELLEIESTLRQAPGVRDAVVTLGETEAGEKRLIAYLAGESLASSDLTTIRGYIQSQLPEYMQPSGWVILDKMPLNENFKISRRALPSPTRENLIVIESFVAPRTEAEKTMADIWCEVLKAPSVGVLDEFGALGGDSLVAMYISMLATEKGINVSPLDFQTQSTIVKLLEARQETTEKRRLAEKDEIQTRSMGGLSPFMLHFLTERGESKRDRWNVSRMLVAARRLSATLIERTLTHLGERHDALRLRIFNDGEIWGGEVLDSSEGTLRFSSFSLGGLSPEGRLRTIRVVAASCQKDINLKSGPIAHLVLFDSGESEPQELYFVVHHLMMDVISWKNFWFEFEMAYAAFEAGLTPSSSSRPISVREWSSSFGEVANSEATIAIVRNGLRRDWQKVREIPKDYDVEWTVNTNRSVSVVSSILSESQTQALLRIGSFGIELESVLIASLARSLSAWQGTELVHFDRLVHGRDVAPSGWDISRTIGCLVSYAPTLISVDANCPITLLLEHVTAQMESMDKFGKSIELFKYYGREQADVASAWSLPTARVMLNYRGDIDAVFDRSGLFAEAYNPADFDHDPDGMRRYPIAISVDVVGGCLKVSWVFSTSIHKADTIESLSKAFEESLVSVVDGISTMPGGKSTLSSASVI